MRVNKLILHNFRNYPNLNIEFTHNVNIFIGDNAQGKTNILEALYYGAMGRSHRTAFENDIVRWQERSCNIDIKFSRIDIENSLTFKLIISHNNSHNKEIIYNGHIIKPREVIGALNAVLFSPEDLLLIKGPPAGRRQFLDMEISQANPSYYRKLLEYNRIVSQRNNLLKKIRDYKAKADLLETWDEQLAKSAAIVVAKRQDALKKLAMLANLMQRKITANKENLTINYAWNGLEEGQPDPDDPVNWYRQKIAILRNNDILRGSTGIGPHRDDIILTVNGVNLRNFGSQGQQRTGVLALKLAELEFIKSETGEYPILLLDDVMSELDAVRREQLLTFIKDRIQTFITATDEKYFPNIKIGKYYRVINGTVTEW